MLYMTSFNAKEGRARELQEWVNKNEDVIKKSAPRGWTYRGTYGYVLGFGRFGGAQLWECSKYGDFDTWREHNDPAWTRIGEQVPAPRHLGVLGGIRRWMNWVGDCRPPAPPDRVPHGGAGNPPRRHGRLRPVAPPGRPDLVRPPMEPTTQSPGREEAHEGGAGGFYNASLEAVRRRDGTGLPALPTSRAGQPLKSMSSARRRMTIHSRCGSRRKPLSARTDERCLTS